MSKSVREIDYTRILCHSCKKKGFKILFECPTCHFYTCKDCMVNRNECKKCFEKTHKMMSKDKDAETDRSL
jgi:hypothetical protein